MSSADIRQTMNLLEAVQKSQNQNQIIELIHEIFKLQGQEPIDTISIKQKITQLLSLVEKMDKPLDDEYHARYQSATATMASLVKQLDTNDDTATHFRSTDQIRILIKKILKIIYNELLVHNDLEELAKNNQEAKEKIAKLAGMINSRSKDENIKKASKLIYANTKQIT